MEDALNLNLTFQDLRNRLRHLIGEVIGAGLDTLTSVEGKKFIIELKETHNKLALAVLTQERNILAITGLQGAGKTTIVKRLYNLDDSYLSENLGRGEQIPILITEYDIKQPEGQVWRGSNQSGDYEIEAKIVEPEEFRQIAASPSEEDIWLELKVPYEYFHDPKKSLVLLPGFEKDQNQRSQQLLMHLLYLSTSSVVVIRKDTYARQTNEAMFKRVKEIYKNVKPIYMLSHGDINPEQNQAMKEQMLNDFSINTAEEDRIVISGDPDRYGAAWINTLKEAMSKYGYVTGESQRKQYQLLEQLTDLIREQLNQLEQFLKSEENKYILNDNNRYGNTAHLVHTFEVIYEKDLDRLEKLVKDALSNNKNDAQERFNKFIRDNHGFWKSFGSRFTSNALRDQEKLQQAIHDAWADAAADKPEQIILKVVEKFLAGRTGFLDTASEQEATSIIQTIPDIPDISEQNRNGISSIESSGSIYETINERRRRQSSLERINRFFDLEDHEYTLVEPLKREDLQTLYVIGVLLSSQSLIAQPLIAEVADMQEMMKKGVPIEADRVKAMDKTVENVKAFSKQLEELKKLSPVILKNIPIILGVDIVLDGESDILSNATKALAGLGITISPLGLATILGAGFAAVYTINAVQKGVKETNKHQLELSQSGKIVIDALPGLQSNAFIQSLRYTLEMISERLEEVHSKRIGAFDQDGNLARIQYASRKIKKLNSEIQKQLFVQYDGLTL